MTQQPDNPPNTAGKLAEPTSSENLFEPDDWMGQILAEQRAAQARGGGLPQDRPPGSAIAGSLRFLG